MSVKCLSHIKVTGHCLYSYISQDISYIPLQLHICSNISNLSYNNLFILKCYYSTAPLFILYLLVFYLTFGIILKGHWIHMYRLILEYLCGYLDLISLAFRVVDLDANSVFLKWIGGWRNPMDRNALLVVINDTDLTV